MIEGEPSCTRLGRLSRCLGRWIRLLLMLAGVAWALAESQAMAKSVDADAVIRRAQVGMGGADVRTITFTGKGSGGLFGQAYEPNLTWPKVTIPIMIRVLDFEHEAFREDANRLRAEVRGGGGLAPFGEGDGPSIGFMRDGYSWTTVGSFIGPAPGSYETRVHDLWASSPQGAILAAKRYNAVAEEQSESGQDFTTLTFAIPNVMQAVVRIDANGLVTEVAAKIPNPVLGDMDIVTHFEEYRSVAGIKFPTRIRETQGGGDFFDIAVSDVRLDLPSDTEVPSSIRTAPKSALAVEKIADGVWFLRGSTHNSVAVEMADHILLVEAPVSDGFALQAFTNANGFVPGKTVRSVLVTHHHFDHTGGLRYAASQGATLFVSAVAKPYYERIFANPNRIAPDSLALSGKTPAIVAIGAKHVFSDSLRTVEMHEIPDSLHARGFLVVYLPKEKILIEADSFHIRPQTNPLRPLPVATEANLIDNVKRLGLQADRILPLHGRASSMEELHSRSGEPGHFK
jgi:glyoxylase-like metal-dependent hydrolase (beta-lactamase superfamily II)